MDLSALVHATRRRLCLGAVLGGLAAGWVATAATLAVWGVTSGSPWIGAGVGLALAGALALARGRMAAHRWTPSATAGFIEARAGGLDNLVVTAAALAEGHIEASDRMRDEVRRQADARVSTLDARALVPLTRAAVLVAITGVGALALTWGTLVRTDPPSLDQVVPPASTPIRGVSVTVRPPAYLDAAPETFQDPEQVTLHAGSAIHLEVSAAAPHVWVETEVAGPRPMVAASRGIFVSEWTPAETTAIVVAAGETPGTPLQTRLLQVTMVPDATPSVRVAEPGRDLAFGAPTAMVDLAIEASDAERLTGLRVTYVKTSGSGESFVFAEGQVPVTIEPLSPRQWRGRARLSLASLGLEDGDAIVYRALVRDSNPAGDWVSSDAFTIDVGSRLEFAGAGFAVPDEDRRYAISQQMVIVKTERALAERGRLSADEWAEQTRGLAVEQRMVRGEVIFLSGGEVQDEVEEAEHGHELQEGRLENAGRAEMLRAINEMSRAEARLNAGDAAGALVFERQALAALQRAFDRRRYFLRTLSERSRIDPARRLTGDLSKAESRTRPLATPAGDDSARLRALLAELAKVAAGTPPGAAFLARLASIDVSDAAWRQDAAALASATTAEARRDAAEAVMARIARRALQEAGPQGPAVEMNDLRGWWREESPAGRRP